MTCLPAGHPGPFSTSLQAAGLPCPGSGIGCGVSLGPVVIVDSEPSRAKLVGLFVDNGDGKGAEKMLASSFAC